eukprot:scaffold149_cov315-Pinguiococcus_pyrenoidosus.AAC.155
MQLQAAGAPLRIDIIESELAGAERTAPASTVRSAQPWAKCGALRWREARGAACGTVTLVSPVQTMNKEVRAVAVKIHDLAGESKEVQSHMEVLNPDLGKSRKSTRALKTRGDGRQSCLAAPRELRS